MTFLVAAFVSSASLEAKAMYIRHQTQQVPIERLITNLQQRLLRDTNNFELTYDLARLHSMAYSAKLDTISVITNTGRPEFYYPGSDTGVPKRIDLPPSQAERTRALVHLTNAIRLYERAILLLKRSTNEIRYKEWLVLPLELGHAWCVDQTGSRKDALAAYRRALALAWKKEVTGEFSIMEWIQDKWNAVKSGNNPLGKTTPRRYIGDVCYSQEIIAYMLKLLDPVKDAKEIAELQDNQKTINSMGRMVTPVLVPLEEEAQLSELVDTGAAVTFDLDGSGLRRQWGWITPKAAWVVYDPQGDGQITSALQMFGNVTFWVFWRDGYAALRSLDDDDDGTLRDAELRGIALWQDANGNGVSDAGEVRPLSAWGITAISCAGEIDANGVVWCPTGVTFSNGKIRPTYDWIAPSQTRQQ